MRPAFFLLCRKVHCILSAAKFRIQFRSSHLPDFHIVDYCFKKTGIPNAEFHAISVAKTLAHFIPLGKANSTVSRP